MSDWDHRWNGLQPVDEGAFIIGDLLEEGMTPEEWNALTLEDREAVARISVMKRSLGAAIETIRADDRADVRASARAMVGALFLTELEQRKVNGSFFETRRGSDLLPVAIEYRVRLERMLASAKLEAKFDKTFYEASVLVLRVDHLKAQWLEQEKFFPLCLEGDDLLALKSFTPKVVASTVSSRQFGISAEAIRLGFRRTKRAATGGKKA